MRSPWGSSARVLPLTSPSWASRRPAPIPPRPTVLSGPSWLRAGVGALTPADNADPAPSHAWHSCSVQQGARWVRE